MNRHQVILQGDHAGAIVESIKDEGAISLSAVPRRTMMVHPRQTRQNVEQRRRKRFHQEMRLQ